MVEIKKITVELKELRKISTSIAKIVSANIKSEKVRYRLSKLAKILINELTELEKERQRLVKQFGEKDEKGNLIVKPEHEEEFNQRFDELQDESIEVSYIPVDLTGVEAGLNAVDMLNLEPFLDEKYIEKLMTDDEPIEVKKDEAIKTKEVSA